MTHTSTKEQILERLLHDCIIAIDALSASSHLNLDCLEHATYDTIEVARETLRVVKANTL